MASPHEMRFLPTAKLTIERRGEGDAAKPVMVGHAAVFDQVTTLYEGRDWVWREVIRPGAFTDAIKESQDVRSLFNHDPNFVLGRTTNGTLKLTEDGKGLAIENELPTNYTIRHLVIEPIERGDISGMSFAFLVRQGGEKVTFTEDDQGRLLEERELLSLDLFDISPVTFPAYEGTSVGLRSARSFDEYVKQRDVPRRRNAPRRDALAAWLASQNSASSVPKG